MNLFSTPFRMDWRGLLCFQRSP